MSGNHLAFGACYYQQASKSQEISPAAVELQQTLSQLQGLKKEILKLIPRWDEVVPIPYPWCCTWGAALPFLLDRSHLCARCAWQSFSFHPASHSRRIMAVNPEPCAPHHHISHGHLPSTAWQIQKETAAVSNLVS